MGNSPVEGVCTAHTDFDALPLNAVASAKFKETADQSMIVRTIVLAVAVVALVLCLVAVRTGRERTAAAATGPSDFGADAYDVVVTAPTEPSGFVDTAIWALPSQASALFAGADGLPTLRVDSLETGSLIGLEKPQGLVALSLMPPGLHTAPVELLISPHATVLALVGLHPQITSSDPDTHLARLIVAAQTPELATLAGIIDGERALATWGRAEQDALQRIVASVLAGAVADGAECPSGVSLGGPLTVCGDMIANSSSAAVLIANAQGQPCQLVPGATQEPSGDGRSALRSLIANGTPIDPGVPFVSPAESGSASLDPSCGGEPQAAVNAAQNPLWVSSSAQFRAWADDITPMARILGADIDDTSFPAANPDTTSLLRSIEVGTSGTPTPVERVRSVASALQTPRVATERGLLPLTTDAITRLQGLTDLLAGLYR